MDRSPQRPEHVDVIDSYRSAIALSPNKEIRQFYIDAIEALGGESSENWNETASCSSLALRGDDIFSSLSTSSDACDGRGNQGYNQGCISIRNSDGDAEDATNTVSFADEWDGQDESKTENRANVGGKPTGVPSVVERLSHIKEFLATVNEAERNDLLQQILAGLSDDDLRSVLQSMRRLPWETDKQVQTEIPDLTSQSRRKNNNDGVEGCDDAERNKDGCTIATDHLLRATRLHPGATRPLSIFIKLRGQSKGSKPKLIPVRQLKRTIAKIYEDKCAADLVDDREKNARSQMPNFVYDYHLKTYGVKSLAHKNLASLIASVFSYSDPDSKDHSGYDRRVHLFGRLAGILDPYDYQEHYCDFTIHFLPKLIGDPKAVDERMNAENPMYNAEQVATLLEDWFGRFNVPAPESVKRRVLEAGSANATNAGVDKSAESLGMIHLDVILQLVYEEWRDAAEARARELLAVFKCYDKNGDRALDLSELTQIVHDIDAGNTAEANGGVSLLQTTIVTPGPRSDSDIHRMYVHAVDDDDDDDDVISKVAFVHMCFIETLGIGEPIMVRTARAI